MAHFNLGPLKQWFQVAMGELHSFELPRSGVRNVELDILSDGFVVVRAVAGENAWIVATGAGHQSVRFTMDEPVGLVVMGDPETDCFFRTRVGAQVIGETGEVSYTTIEPRQSVVSDEVRRMMMMMRLNQERREKALREELQAVRLAQVEQTRTKAPTLQERQAAKATEVPVIEEPTSES